MLRIMLTTILLFNFMLVTNSLASEYFTIEGRILTENNTPISNVSISIGEQKVLTNSKGLYRIKVPANDIYRINISKKNYFDNIQTFSHFELNSKLDKNLVADITLVAKKESRVMLAFGGDTMMGRRFYKPYFGDAILIHPEK